MSRHDYECSKKIADQQWPFYALIMAAMRQADTDNAIALRVTFPDTWFELQERYNAPGGLLPTDRATPLNLAELEEIATLRTQAGVLPSRCIVCGDRDIVTEYRHKDRPEVVFALCKAHELRAIEYAGAEMWSKAEKGDKAQGLEIGGRMVPFHAYLEALVGSEGPCEQCGQGPEHEIHNEVRRVGAYLNNRRRG